MAMGKLGRGEQPIHEQSLHGYWTGTYSLKSFVRRPGCSGYRNLRDKFTAGIIHYAILHESE
jgi:hypothetical protein